MAKPTDKPRRVRATDMRAAQTLLGAQDSQLAVALSEVAQTHPELVTALADSQRRVQSSDTGREAVMAQVEALRGTINRFAINQTLDKLDDRGRKQMEEVLARMGHGKLTFQSKRTPRLDDGTIPLVPLRFPPGPKAFAVDPDAPWLPVAMGTEGAEAIAQRREEIVERASQQQGKATVRGAEWGTIGDAIDFTEQQGVVGTPFSGSVNPDGLGKTGVPNVEQNYSLQPYLARGLSTDPGEYEQIDRANSPVQQGIGEQTNLIAGATWEFTPPDIPTDLIRRFKTSKDPEVQALAKRFDIDACWRACEAMNLELVVNRDVIMRRTVESFLRTFLVQGFAISEFGLRDSDIGSRITGFEDRLPSSIDEWVMRGDSRLAGFIQSDPNTGRRPVVDIRKCLYAARKITGSNWEGISAIRSAYGWDLLSQEFVASAILHRQRFGPGVPYIERTDGQNNSAEASREAYQALSQYANLADAVLEIGAGVKVGLLQMKAEEGLVEVLEYCTRMQREAVGAQIAGVGTEGVGSYAAGDIRSRFMLANYQSTADAVAAAFSSFADAYCSMFFPGIGLKPVMKVSGILTRSPKERIEVQSLFADLGAKKFYSADEMRLIAKDGDIIWHGPADTDAVTPEETATGTAGSLPGTEPEPEGDGTNETELEPPVANEEPERRAATAECGCQDCSTTRALQGEPRVRIVGRDGKAFATFRALEGPEKEVAWATLNALLADTRAGIADAIAAVQADHKRRFVAAARPLIEARDFEALANLRIPMEVEYQYAIMRRLQKLSVAASNDMLAEIRAQLGGSNWRPTGAGTARPLAQWIAANSQLMARRMADVANERMANVALQAASGGGQNLLRTYDFGELGHQTKGLAAQITSATLNASREEIAKALGPKIVRARYSAILDQYTCPACASADGRTMLVGSAEYVRLSPPNSRCRSLKSSRGGANECRCVYVYEFDTTAANDDVEAPTLANGGLALSSMISVLRAAGLSAGLDERRREIELEEALGIALDAFPADDDAPRPLVMIWGPPASGKTTLARKLSQEEDLAPSVWVESDDYRLNSDGEFDPSEASRQAYLDAVQAAIEGDPLSTVIVSGVLVGERTREAIFQSAKLAGREVVSFRAGAWMTLDDLVAADAHRASTSSRKPIAKGSIAAMLKAADERACGATVAQGLDNE
jgi:hypothetical protein